MLKVFGSLIIFLLTAIAMIVTALFAKGTAYENAWLYILAVGFILSAVFEVYAKRKDKDQR